MVLAVNNEERVIRPAIALKIFVNICYPEATPFYRLTGVSTRGLSSRGTQQRPGCYRTPPHPISQTSVHLSAVEMFRSPRNDSLSQILKAHRLSTLPVFLFYLFLCLLESEPSNVEMAVPEFDM